MTQEHIAVLRAQLGQRLDQLRMDLEAQQVAADIAEHRRKAILANCLCVRRSLLGLDRKAQDLI